MRMMVEKEKEKLQANRDKLDAVRKRIAELKESV